LSNEAHITLLCLRDAALAPKSLLAVAASSGNPDTGTIVVARTGELGDRFLRTRPPHDDATAP
jgi:hypothetical protein